MQADIIYVTQGKMLTIVTVPGSYGKEESSKSVELGSSNRPSLSVSLESIEKSQTKAGGIKMETKFKYFSRQQGSL